MNLGSTRGMRWSFLKEEPPESALEGIVYKEGAHRLFRRWRLKKRLLVYDEITKCLRYYTPQRALKGTIYLHDILTFIPLDLLKEIIILSANLLSIVYSS